MKLSALFSNGRFLLFVCLSSSRDVFSWLDRSRYRLLSANTYTGTRGTSTRPRAAARRTSWRRVRKGTSTTRPSPRYYVGRVRLPQILAAAAALVVSKSSDRGGSTRVIESVDACANGRIRFFRGSKNSNSSSCLRRRDFLSATKLRACCSNRPRIRMVDVDNNNRPKISASFRRATFTWRGSMSATAATTTVLAAAAILIIPIRTLDG